MPLAFNPEPVMTRQVVLDVSAFQPANIDFARIRRESGGEVVGVIIKATEGQWSGTNPGFEAQYAAARAAGFKVGFYCFDHTSVNADYQANLYLAKVAGKTAELGHWLDFEANDAGAVAGAVQGHVSEWLNRVSAVYPGQVGVYSAPWAWDPWTGGMDASRFPLWLAGYTAQLPPSPAHWGRPSIWQFTDAYPTYFGGCDASVLLDLPAGPSPVSIPTDWSDMATKDEIKAALREVLDEGTANGQVNWARTNKAILGVEQANFNALRAIADAVRQVYANTKKV
jgi:hypothetical protein